jgi:Transposase DDE domain
MPYKFNESRRHKIPVARYRVTNWPEYDAALVRRGSLLVWFTEEAVEAWHALATGERGGQPIYSAVAIETGLALRLVFHQPLRQTEACCDRSPPCSASISRYRTIQPSADEAAA